MTNAQPPASILICSLSQFNRHIQEQQPSHLLSLLTPSHMPPTPASIAPENHLKVACHDIIKPFPGAIHPCESHIEAIVDFAASWNRQAPMLVHCFAGVSRSSAAALVVAASLRVMPIHELTTRLRDASPHAHPNERIIALADESLGFDGAFVHAVKAMGYGALTDRAPLSTLTLEPCRVSS